MKRLPFFTLALFIFTACAQQKSDKLTIAAAANVQFAMQELIVHFKNTTDISSHVIYSSSGKLTAQISEGAPYDLFISADMKYPTELHRAGLTTTPPKSYAYGKLVVWTMMEDLQKSDISIASLAERKAIKHISIANPKTAPYGEAAVEALNYYELYDTLQSKLVYGESISQVNQFILSKTAEAGITAMSVVLSPKIKEQGQWVEIPSVSYSPISQGAVVLKNGREEKANAFFEFLFSEEAQLILKKYGYAVKE